NARAQANATIIGTVADASGNVVANASITITQKETGLTRQVTTSDRGYYVVPSLPVGTYTVAVEVKGFKRKSVTGITLQVNDEPRIDVTLEVGEVSETVTVDSQAPLLQTESASVGQVIDNRYTTQIPLNGRDFTQLILLTPGAVTRPGGYDLSTGAATGSLGSGVAIGGRDAHNNFTIDGAGNNARQFGNVALRPSIDVIQEFKVQTNSYSAEFGQAAFGQITLVTKSGTNQLHGSAFEFLRNDKFDARNFFLPKRGKLNRNQFGGTIGGPIIKNRTFFLFNFEGLRERRGVEAFASVPPEAWREGDFSGVPGLVLRDPQTGAQFPGNRIPENRIHPTARAALALWAMPNTGAPGQTANNLLVTHPNEVDDDQFTAKVDHQFSEKDRLNFRYTRSARTEFVAATGAFTVTPLLPGFENINPPVNQVASLNHTHIFTPHLLGEFRFSFTRSLFVAESVNTGKDGFYEQFGINNTIPGPRFEGAPTFNFQGITLTPYGDGDFVPQKDVSNEFSYAGAFTWTRGDHSLKLGFSLTRYQQNTPGPITGYRRGQFTFRGDFTGNAFADFLLGLPISGQRVVGTGVETGRSWWHAYYFNDDWKVSPRLTLTLGLRYEYVSPLVDNLNRRSTFYPLTNAYGTGQRGQIIVANSPEAKNILGLDGVGARALYGPDRNNFAPRFGFAYSANAKTVIRAGYGIFFTNSQNFINNFVINRRQPPFAETQQITSSTTTPQIDVANPFSNATAPSVVGTQNIDPNFREGYVQQWNLSLQRQLPGGIGIDVSYVGNKGTKLTELIYFNIPTPGPTATVQARRPFPAFGTALSLNSYVASSYHALLTKVQKRFSSGLQFLASYTWSKSIDTSSERGNGDRGGGFEGGDPRDLIGYFRGPSGFDIRHRFVVSYVYELPFGKNKQFLGRLPAAANRLIGGWEVSGITQYQSGFPFSVLMSGDQNGDGLGGDRPDLVGIPVINSGNPNCYIVDPRNPACGGGTAAFAPVPAGVLRYGN
ncbi:MAG: carboxypeptidase regulatory-like domain-containing protein, partial [Blastocatellia bacterium]|nr:carboxypeptidase regulatory-like domain-containing protein [Blastocatellia bacterium]